MTDFQHVVFVGTPLLLAVLIATVIFLVNELSMLRLENKVLREQRDTWIKIATGEVPDQ